MSTDIDGFEKKLFMVVLTMMQESCGQQTARLSWNDFRRRILPVVRKIRAASLGPNLPAANCTHGFSVHKAKT